MGSWDANTHDSPPGAQQTSPAHAAMPTTHWTQVARLKGDDPHAAGAALAALLTRYTPALRAYLMRRWRFKADVAEDLVQEFLKAKFLETNLARRADPARGKFRTLVLTALRNFVISAARRRGLPFVEDTAAAQAADVAPTPDEHMVVEWARTLLREAIRRMEIECTPARRATWVVFDERLLRPLLEGEPATPYAQLTARLGFADDEATQNALVTGKRMFQRHLRGLVSEYVERDADVEQEIREIQAVFSRLTGERRPDSAPDAVAEQAERDR